MLERTDGNDWARYAQRTMELPDLQKKCEWFARHLPNEGKLLDLGCGTGRYAEAFARAHPGIEVDAWDPSPRMFSIASDRQLIQAEQKGALNLEAEGLYDAIWANVSLQFLPQEELPEAFERMGKALKAGGILGITFVKKVPDMEHMSAQFQRDVGFSSSLTRGELYTLLSDQGGLTVEYLGETMQIWAGNRYNWPQYEARARKPF